MSVLVEILCPQGEAKYNGLRLTADEYSQLEDDGCRYELIDGVVCMTPSPVGVHTFVVGEITAQIGAFLRKHPLGRVAVGLDVHVGEGPRGRELVYRPDVLFLRSEHVRRGMEFVSVPPDLIVEVVSVTSRRLDQVTKKADYERFGVAEYWVLDPERDAMCFYRLEAGKYVEVQTEENIFRSVALPGLCSISLPFEKSSNLRSEEAEPDA